MTNLKPMLAGKFPGEAKLKFPLIAQPKLDGIRCVIKDGVALSRTLKPIPNKYVQSILGHSKFNGLDGELIVGSPTAEDCYRQTVSGIMSEDKLPDFTYFVFDNWNHSGAYTARRDSLTEIVYGATHPSRFQLVWDSLVFDQAELDTIEARYIEQGYEGAILRGPQTTYKYGRGNATNGDLLKLKRFKDFEAVIVGVEEEMHNANEAKKNALGRTERSSHKAGKVGKGTLGAFYCQRIVGWNGAEPTLDPIQFKVGTGFSAEERAELWREHHVGGDDPNYGFIGCICKVKSFPVGEHEKPRHPVWLGFRPMLDIGEPV